MYIYQGIQYIYIHILWDFLTLKTLNSACLGWEVHLRVVLNLSISPFLVIPHTCPAFLKYAI